MEGDYRIFGGGKAFKPKTGIHRHQLAGYRLEKRLQDIGDDDGISDGDTHGACQRQPAQQTAGPTQIFTPGSPCIPVRTQSAGAGTAADGILSG